jgi:hypothetical protein
MTQDTRNTKTKSDEYNLCAYSSCDGADNDDHLEQVDTESERCNR